MGLDRQISKNLRVIRHEKGLSQRELSETTGFDEKFISQLENKPRHISTKTLERLAKGLNISPSELIKSKGSGKANNSLPKSYAVGFDEAIKILKMHRMNIKEK
ncbi:MAG: helix-turn-helix domain-containing protein [Oligoflexales bacterium]